MPSREDKLLRNKLPNVRRRWSRVDGAGLLALVVVGSLLLVVDTWWAMNKLPNVRRWIIVGCDLLILVVVLYPFWWLGQ